MADTHRIRLESFPKHRPFSLDAVQIMRENCGGELPKEYLEFIAPTNGGFVIQPNEEEYYVFEYLNKAREIPEIDWNRPVLFLEMASIPGVGDEGDNVLFAYENLRVIESIPKNVVPIACTFGDDTIAIDVGPANYGRVILFPHDEYPLPKDGYHVVSQSFGEFLVRTKTKKYGDT